MSSHESVGQAPNPPQADSRFRLALAGLVLCVAACGAGGNGEEGAQSHEAGIEASALEQPSPTDPLLEDLQIRTGLTRSLRRSSGLGVEEAREQLSALDPEDREQVADLARIITGQETVNIIEGAENPYDAITLEDARNQASALSDEFFRTAATTAIDNAQASQIVRDLEYEDDAAKFTEGREALLALPPSPQRDLSLRLVDIHEARRIFSQARFGYNYPREQALSEAANISDPALRERLTAGIEAGIAYRTTYDSDLASTLLEIDTNLLRTLNDLNAQRRESENSTTNPKVAIEDFVRSELQASDQRVTEMIKQQNQLPELEAVIALEALSNPQELFDLTDVQGTKLIRDAYELLDNPEAEPLEQFAEIYVENGELVLKVQEDTNLTETGVQQLRDLLDRLKPLLAAGFGNGDISSIHFVASADYNPYYLPSTREIYMILPTDDSTSLDQLHSGLIHEAVHALTRSAFAAGAEVAPDELANLAAACNSLRNSALDSVSLSFQPEDLSAVRDLARPEHQAIFDVLIQLDESYTLPSILQETSMTQYAGMYFNNCYGFNLADLIMYAAGQAGNSELEWEDLSYLTDNEAFSNLAQKWYDAMHFYAIYNDLNESAFVDTDYLFSDYLGHSQDNASEMVASVANAAVSFTPEFIEMTSGMTPRDKMATIQSLQISFDLIMNRHPSLVPYLTQLEADILTGINH